MKAIVVESHGGPEVLQLKERPLPSPGTGQVLIKVHAAGVNFIDVYHRTGRYPGTLPLLPGLEGAGIVDAVGPGVAELRAGARVAWANVPGSYATHVIAPADRLVPLPEDISFEDAAAAMLQGMTAHFLSHSAFPLQSGHTALVHAGAGGVGLLLTQMAKRRGARVITTVSTPEKAKASRQAGASDVIIYTEQDFVTEVKRLTDGKGVDVVYDSVGRTTFEKGLDALQLRGMMVLFGGSSGPVPPLDPMVLNQKGSLFLTRPKLGDYVADRGSLLLRAGDVLAQVAQGELKLTHHRSYSLAQAELAHQHLEGRTTSGKLLLLPQSAG